MVSRVCSPVSHVSSLAIVVRQADEAVQAADLAVRVEAAAEEAAAELDMRNIKRSAN